jgi:hypothetical protein
LAAYRVNDEESASAETQQSNSNRNTNNEKKRVMSWFCHWQNVEEGNKLGSLRGCHFKEVGSGDATVWTLDMIASNK